MLLNFDYAFNKRENLFSIFEPKTDFSKFYNYIKKSSKGGDYYE